jgi:hemoglobin
VITEGHLETLIPAFYARVRRDPLIGPVFEAAVEDWDEHLHKLIAFWSSVMLGSGRYRGNPMMAHLRQRPNMTPEMFDRWLALWAEETREQLPEPMAAALQQKANRIGESLKLGLWFRMPSGVPAPAA